MHAAVATSRAIAVAVAGLVAVSVCRRAQAVEGGEQMLAVLLVARADPDRAREARFIDELGLTLDGFEIKLIDPGPADFPALSLKDELEAVQTLTEPLGAAATIWIESASPDVTMLHVVALSTGRAFIRIVEAKQGPGAERELAIAADELLGQVYMLSPPPVAAPVAAVVGEVVERAAELRQRKRAVELGVATFFTTSGALYRREGSWLRLGGGAALELWPAGGLLVRAGFSVVAGPFFDPDDGAVSGYGLHPELGAAYLWTLGRLRLGPVASAAAMRSTVTLALGQGTAHTATWWSLRGALGLQARLALGPAVAVFLEPSVGVWSHPRRFERVSDGRVALRTPLVDWGASLGVCYTF
jgi:hypothetical protein